MAEKKLYYFSGAVTRFGVVVNPNWNASTYAESESKARSNLKYRFAKENNFSSVGGIVLEGTIKKGI